MQSYNQFISSVVELYESKEYDQALKLLESGMNQFPEQAQSLLYARACLTAVLGKEIECTNILLEGLEQGLWFPVEMLRNDPDLALLQGNTEFEEIVEICKQRTAIAQAASQPQRKLIVPEGKPPYRLLLTLHGNNGNMKEFEPFWKEEALGQGWALLLAQSSQIWGPDRYVWNDRSVAIQEVTEHFSETQAETGVQDEHVIISGFSMGAGVAIWMALTGAIKTKGFVAVAPSLRDVESLMSFKDKFAPKLRGYFIVGERDTRSVELTSKITELMESQGLQFHVETHSNLGHEFPMVFSESLVNALSFVDSDLE